MKTLLKRHLPPAFLDIARRLRGALPFWAMTRKGRWIRREYCQFGQDQRDFVFMSIARFLHINRPVPGYYFEFGCNEANTIRKAWDHFQHLFDFTYVGFDSFEGLPAIAEADQQLIWKRGKLAFAEERFIRRVRGHGVPAGKLRTVKGFYDVSLTRKLKDSLLPARAPLSTSIVICMCPRFRF